jgi:hypothetical protein
MWFRSWLAKIEVAAQIGEDAAWNWRVISSRRDGLGIEGLDEDQLQLPGSDRFWMSIEEPQKQKEFSRAEAQRSNNPS